MRVLIQISRTLVVSAAVGLIVWLTWRLMGQPTAQLSSVVRWPPAHTAGLTVDELVRDLAAALVLVAVGVLTVLYALSAMHALAVNRKPAAARLLSRVTPAGFRRLVAAVCGLGLAAPVGGVGLPAMADDGSRHPACHASCAPPRQTLGGLALPDLPTTPLHVDEALASANPAQRIPRPAAIIVRPGDCLWRLAERRLPSAESSDIARLTQRLYALNRSTIGADPDLIFPGMTLIPPEGTP